jgi:translation initiation factor IF-2
MDSARRPTPDRAPRRLGAGSAQAHRTAPLRPTGSAAPAPGRVGPGRRRGRPGWSAGRRRRTADGGPGAGRLAGRSSPRCPEPGVGPVGTPQRAVGTAQRRRGRAWGSRPTGPRPRPGPGEALARPGPPGARRRGRGGGPGGRAADGPGGRHRVRVGQRRAGTGGGRWRGSSYPSVCGHRAPEPSPQAPAAHASTPRPSLRPPGAMSPRPAPAACRRHAASIANRVGDGVGSSWSRPAEHVRIRRAAGRRVLGRVG